MIVIAGVQRHPLLGSRRSYAEHHVERAIAIERRDLDPYDILEGGKASPERAREINATDRKLQIEPDQRHLGCDSLAVLEEFILGRTFHRGERKENRVVAEIASDASLVRCLLGPANGPRDQEQWSITPARRLSCCELKHRLI